MTDKCPNTNTKEWKTLVAHLGDETEAYRAYMAHNDNIPPVIGMTELKRKIGLTGGPYSNNQKIRTQEKIRRYNEKNGTSHNVKFRPYGAESYTAELVFNYMPVNKAAQQDRDQRRKMEGYGFLVEEKSQKKFTPSESEREAGQFNDEGDFIPPSYFPAGFQRRMGPKFQHYITLKQADLKLLFNKRSELKIKKKNAIDAEEKLKISDQLERLDDKIENVEKTLLKLENLNVLDDINEYAEEDMETLSSIFSQEEPSGKDLDIAARIIKVWQRAGDFSGDEPHIFYDSEEFQDAFQGLSEVTDQFINWKKRADEFNLRLLEERHKLMDRKLKSTFGSKAKYDYDGPMENVGFLTSQVLDISETNNILLQAMHAWVKDANYAAKLETDQVFAKLDSLIKATGLKNFDIFRQTQSNDDSRLTGEMVFRWTQSFFDWQSKIRNERDRAFASAYKQTDDRAAFEIIKRANRKFMGEQQKFTTVFDPRILFWDAELTNAPEPTQAQKEVHIAELKELLGEDGYKEYYDINEKKIRDYKIDRESRRKIAEGEYGENVAIIESYIEGWEIRNSPFLYAEAMEKGFDNVRPNGLHINPTNKYVRSVPKKIADGEDTGFHDQKFQQIQNNKSYLELYNFMFDLMKIMKLYLPHEKISFMQMNSIPILDQKLSEVITENGLLAGFSKSKDDLRKAVRADDLGTTATPEDRKDFQFQHLTNNRQKLKNYLELKDTSYRAENNGKSPDTELVDKWRKDYLNELAQEKSFDLGRIMKAFSAMAIGYNHRAAIEDQMRIADDIIRRGLEKRTNASGQDVRDKHKNLITEKGLENLRKMLDNFMEVAYWHYPSNRPEGASKKKILTEKEKELKTLLENSLKELDSLLEKEKIDQDTYDARSEVVREQLDVLGGVKIASKYGDILLKYIQLKGMGWNVFAAFANMGFGIMSNVIEASDGRNYSSKNFWKAQALVLNSVGRNYSFNTWNGLNGNAKKIRELMNKFDTLKEARNEIYKDTTPSMFKRVGKGLEWANPFSPQSRSEYFNQAPVMIAMMMEEKVTTADGKEISLWDAYETDGNLKDGVTIDEKKIFELKRRIDKLVKMNHGNYDPDSPLLVKRKFIGRALSQFRTWAYQGFAERFRAEFDDYQLINQKTGENFLNRKGRYRSYVAYYTAENNMNAISSTFNLTYQLLRKLVGFNTKFDDLIGEGFTETDAANMRKNMTEIFIFLLLTGLTLALKAAVDDDDDKNSKKKMAYIFMINQIGRLATDVQFYINPIEFERLARNAIPAFSVVVDAAKAIDSAMTLITEGAEGDILQSGPSKGKSRTWRDIQKLIPGPVQYQKLQSAADQVYKK
jgi:hypothetical protein